MRKLFRVQRTAKRPASELLDELLSAAGIIRSGRLARNESAGIAPSKRVRGQPLSRAAVSFREDRRNGKSLILVLETVDKVFGREILGRLGRVPKQIANGVVVLAVRQAAERHARRFPIPHRFLPLVLQSGS